MPNETDDFKLTDKQVERALSDWQDETYLTDLDHREEIDQHDRFMDAMVKHREERELKAAAQARTTDFRRILETNVSKTKRIPIESLEQDWEEKEAAAERDADQGFTTLGRAREDQFAGKRPVLHDGRIIEIIDPDQKPEHVKEVRKGTPSKHVHKSKTSRSKVVWRPKGSNQRDSRDADQRVKTDKELRSDIE